MLRQRAAHTVTYAHTQLSFSERKVGVETTLVVVVRKEMDKS